MSTNTKESESTVYFDPSQCLVEIETEARKLRALLGAMRTLDFRPIVEAAERIENAAYQIDKWASAQDLELDEAQWEANETRWTALVNRMNKHFGSQK